ncbi:MAG: GPI anchored serine-threonine rich family protein [Flavobacteriales bacterium]|nr:GPI anchored serine-threonine rich family protein [Flavobacteriales bacterium]
MKHFLLLLALFANAVLCAQTITITSPNGGEVWQGCTTQTITWNDSGTSNFYSIDYSINGGVNWTSIATFYNTTDGEYVWTVPNIQSTNVLIRVQDSNNNAIEDVSNLNFSLAAPLLLTYPNGNETIQGGDNVNITWVAANTSNYYILEYSLDGGNTWSYIDDFFYNTNGSFNWNVPNTPSANVLVQITDYYEACKSDKSDNLLEIIPATPTITITSPYAGQTYYATKQYNITWTSEYVVSDQVQIEFSNDNGASWQIIASITEDDGLYTWTAPNVISDDYLIRITDLANPSTFDVSDNFSVAAPFIDVTYPNGGEIETQCEQFTITWNSGGSFNNRFRILYSEDNGASWTTIASNQLGSSYNWVYPPIEGPALIRVEDNNNAALFDDSDAPFTLAPHGDIIITSPNGGENIQVGTNHTITWASVSPVNYVELYYSIDNGVSWLLIDDFENSDGNFNWNVPNTPSTECLIRIEDYYNGNCRYDVSDAVFTIVPPTPIIEITNIGAFENQVYYPNKGYNLNWNSEYLTSPFVSIDFSDDNGASWTNIIAATEDDGSYVVTFAEEYSETCLFRVSEVGSMVEGISPYNFAVRPPFIEITYPTGGDVETQCEAFNITWTSGGTFNNRFRIQYSVDNGASWTTIASNQTGTSYNWVYPPVSGPVMVRVEDNTWSYIFDESDTPFTLSPNTDIIITSPNGGETLEVGTNVTINWASVSPVNYVELYYSIDNGASWLLIDDFENSDGNFNWNVPNNPSTQCLIRIEDYYNGNCRFDVSDAIFTIAPPTPVIEITNIGAIENQVYYPNKGYNLNWNSEYLTSPFVSIDFSDDNGASWTNIIAATEDDGSYVVTFAEEYSEVCLFRVSEVGSMVEGISPFNFAVRPPFIEITYPTGGEVETQCEAFNITWTSGGTFNNRFRIQYSVDNGASWTTIASNQTGTFYNWVYPPVSGPVMVRVEDNTWSYIFDESDTPFTLSPNNDIIVTSPNGGETLISGTIHQITWASISPVNYVQIYLSLDNGVTWDYIDDFENSDGLYNWNVPNTPSSECLVRIVDYYNAACRVDESDATFSIEQPEPQVTYPNTSQVFGQYQTVNITWTDEYYNSSFVLIELSEDNGASWQTISAAEVNDGSYSWLVPEVISTECLIRITSIDNPSETDVSDETFEIREAIIVTSPNGDNGIQDWRVCTETTVTWTSVGTSAYFRIYYSTDNGNSWTSLNSNYYSPGVTHSFDWILPSAPSPATLVRVENRYNTLQVDESDDTFTIAPAITITGPNGGEVLGVGQNIDITWLNEGASEFYDIDYSVDGGVSWNNIAFNVYIPNESYSWVVPGQLSTNYLIRVTDNIDNCKSDISDDLFEVSGVQQGLVNLNYPLGGESFAACNQVVIDWNAVNTSDEFTIDYSLDNGVSWNNIVSNFYTLDQQYVWTVPNNASAEALIRVYDSTSPVFTDQSNFGFNISAPVASAGNDVTICVGETTVLQASGGVSYAWSPSAGLSDAGSSSPNASPTTTTTYTVTITDVNGCTADDFVIVTVESDCDITGCTDENAWNYNPNATFDDGFCLYTEGGNVTCAEDINGDGIVSTGDLLSLLGAYGQLCD